MCTLSQHESATDERGREIDDLASRTLALAEQVVADGAVQHVPDAAIQALLVAAVRLYSAKRETGVRLEAFERDRVTATEADITAVGLTEAVNLELFELALWNGWSNV